MYKLGWFSRIDRRTEKLFLSCFSLVALFLTWMVAPCQSFSVSLVSVQGRLQPRHFYLTAAISSGTEIAFDESSKTLSESPCFWKPTWNKGKWQRRIHIQDLRVGQKLQGNFVQELLEGKTGPKLFFEVGVGRTDSTGRWSIVNGMLRLDRAKQSVTKKRASRLRQKEAVEVWVSRVQAGCGRLEVCLSEDDVDRYQDEPKIPITSLCVGQELRGRVVRILPYGVMVDVGANRLGLLHIGKVRALYGKFIDKEKGLTEAGLERGAQVRLCVEAVEKRRLSLDFTEDVKSEAKAELEANLSKATKSFPPVANQDQRSEMSAMQLDEWADFAQSSDSETAVMAYDDSDEDDYDEYDEERDIEDSLGLGYY